MLLFLVDLWNVRINWIIWGKKNPYLTILTNGQDRWLASIIRINSATRVNSACDTKDGSEWRSRGGSNQPRSRLSFGHRADHERNSGEEKVDGSRFIFRSISLSNQQLLNSTPQLATKIHEFPFPTFEPKAWRGFLVGKFFVDCHLSHSRIGGGKNKFR